MWKLLWPTFRGFSEAFNRLGMFIDINGNECRLLLIVNETRSSKVSSCLKLWVGIKLFLAPKLYHFWPTMLSWIFSDIPPLMKRRLNCNIPYSRFQSPAQFSQSVIDFQLNKILNIRPSDPCLSIAPICLQKNLIFH